METQSKNKIILFNTRDELIKIDLRYVAYFHAARNYTEVFFTNGYDMLLTTSLSNIEQVLNTQKVLGRIPVFVRIGRSFIINLRHIVHIDVLRQRLVINDPKYTHVYSIEMPREALKNLKELYTRK